MAIDPTIASNVYVPRSSGFDPVGALSQIADVQTAKLKIDEARRRSMARMRIQQLAALHPDDPDAFISALGTEYPMEAQEYAEQVYKARKEKYDAYGKQLDTETKGFESATRLLQATNGEPDAYGIVREGILKRDPRLEAVLPPSDQLTPERFQQVLSLGQSTTDYLKAKQEGVKLFANGDYRKGLGWTLANAPNAEFAKATLDEAAQDPRARRDVELFRGILANSPDFQQARAQFAQASMTPKEVADVAGKQADDKRADLQFGEAQRHNRVTEGQAATVAAETRRHNRIVENKPTAAAADDAGLVDAVIANPSLWDDLTPTVKGKIAPALQAKGFAGFGKALPPAAVKQIAESDTALDSLKDLRAVLQENEQYIGPIAGLQALNPYSEANKAQARIDLVRQRVGKALEGGVLRKEDEEKYKKILSTLRDTPSTAIYKVDSLIHSIEQDKKNFINEQRLAGRRVNPEAGQGAGGVEVKAPNGKIYKFATQAQADLFKKRAGIP